MSDLVIGNYDAAITIDGAAHYLLIQPGTASAAYKKINRNTLLGVTGQPADISSSQTLSTKTLDNTNSATLKDNAFTVQNSSDTTKQAKLSLSGITTATTRTYTLPDRSSTIATLGGDQAFTGANSFTGSAWSGGTIDNSTVTVDAVSGHTSANSGTIYGIAVASSVPTFASGFTVSGGSLTLPSSSIPASALDRTVAAGKGTTPSGDGTIVTTGLGFQPRVIQFFASAVQGVSTVHGFSQCFGWYDRIANTQSNSNMLITFQASTGPWAGGDSSPDTSNCLRIYDLTSSKALLYTATVTATSSDGFTLTIVNYAGGSDWWYTAWA